MKRYFKLRPDAGDHYEGDKAYKAGDIVESTGNLAKMFPTKFDEVNHTPAPAPQKAVAADEHELPNPPKKAEQVEEVLSSSPVPSTASETKLGKDVTESFVEAEKNGFRVFQGAKGFFVADEDNVEKSLNRKPLKREELAEYIKQLSSS